MALPPQLMWIAAVAEFTTSVTGTLAGDPEAPVALTVTVPL
jgi:hypothetical protein